MGDKNLETGRDGIEKGQASYAVISYKGSDLPAKYRGLIFSNWLKTLIGGNDYFRLMDKDAYFPVYSKYIENLLARPGSLIRLAVLSDDHDVALGWSLTEGSVLHYVWVEHIQRNKGVCMSLVPQKINFITHLTKSGMGVWNSKFKDAKFNPFL